MLSKRSEVNMTKGNIAALLVMFALPLLMGNLFQMFYNMVDTWVVGNYVSDNAFSAVGTVAPILNLFIYTFVGLSNGGAVVVSQYFGAGKITEMRRTVHTMVVITLICCVIFTVAGYALVPAMTHFMKTPDGVLQEQQLYLRILFAFISFQTIYNMGAAVLRAVGDSRKPFIFLCISCVVNIVLDLVFVIVFRMGTAGVAWATVAAQGVSAALCVYTLFTTDASVKLSLKEIKLDTALAGKVLKVGIPTAIQQAITAFSNVFVLGYTNAFGSSVMGGWTIFNKLDQFVMLPQQSLGIAVTTFVGQNMGAGDEKRAKKGMWTAIAICLAVTAVIAAVLVIFAPQLGYFFNKNPEIIDYGTLFIRRIIPFTLFSCVSFGMLSALRGSGNTLVPMIITLSSMVGFRQLYLFTVSHIWPGNLTPVSFAFPAGWLLTFVIMGLYYMFVGFGRKETVIEEK